MNKVIQKSENLIMPKKILIVDDEIGMRKALFEALECPKHEIFMAGNGKETIKIFESTNTNIDLVILDIILPDMNGIEVLSKIRKIPSDVPIIILTAHGSKEIVVESLRRGADYYFDKPFEVEDLLRIVEHLLQIKDSKKYGDNNLICQEEISNGQSTIQKVLDLLKKSYGHYTLQDLSVRLCLSPGYLSKIFKEKTGIGFRAYKKNLKFTLSKKFLEHTFYNVSEIAYKLGYSHPEDFTKQFKRITGFAPTDYRKMRGGGGTKLFKYILIVEKKAFKNHEREGNYMMKKGISIISLTSILFVIFLKPVFALEFFDPIPAPPGFYFATYPIYYTADKYLDKDGKVQNDNLGLSIKQVLFRPVYWSKTSSGHPWVLNLIIPVGKIKIDSINGSDSGIGDVIVSGGYNFLAKNGLFITGVLYTKLPTGPFDKDKATNFGSGQVDILPQLAIAKLWGNIHIEGSVKYFFRFENKDTKVKPGNEFLFEGLAGYKVTENLRMGVEVNTLFGSDNKIDGKTVKNSAVKKISLGPQISYQISPKLNFVTKVTFDVDGENTPKGNLFLVRLFYDF